MDHIGSHSRFPRRRSGCAQQTDRASKNWLYKIVAGTKATMLQAQRNSYGVLVRMRGCSASTDELRRCLLDLVSLTQNERGCLSCELIENRRDSTEFTLLEEWSSELAHSVHFETSEIQVTLRCLSDLVSGEVDLRKHVLQSNIVRYGTNSYCLAGGGAAVSATCLTQPGSRLHPEIMN